MIDALMIQRADDLGSPIICTPGMSLEYDIYNPKKSVKNVLRLHHHKEIEYLHHYLKL